jgi:hypothetical protein
MEPLSYCVHFTFYTIKSSDTNSDTNKSFQGMRGTKPSQMLAQPCRRGKEAPLLLNFTVTDGLKGR